MQIYLDYSATTPTRPEAIALMQHVLAEQWGNPSSPSCLGATGSDVARTCQSWSRQGC